MARVMTRALHVNQKLSWNCKVKLTKEARDELTFWSDNVDSLNRGVHAYSCIMGNQGKMAGN